MSFILDSIRSQIARIGRASLPKEVLSKAGRISWIKRLEQEAKQAIKL